MLHHYLDRGPDGRANPPKRTSVVALGPIGRRYGVAWSALAAGLALAAVFVVDVRVIPLAVAAVVGAAVHATVRVDEPASVTRVEALVICAGILGALLTSILLAPADRVDRPRARRAGAVGACHRPSMAGRAGTR